MPRFELQIYNKEWSILWNHTFRLQYLLKAMNTFGNNVKHCKCPMTTTTTLLLLQTLTSTEAVGGITSCSDGKHINCELVTVFTTHSTSPTDTLKSLSFRTALIFFPCLMQQALNQTCQQRRLRMGGGRSCALNWMPAPFPMTPHTLVHSF